jgi:RNA polymerase sigma-70 factor (ECF subfamily)
LGAARAGSSEALGNALEACRRYLLRIAQRELDPQLRSKGSASDLVQQTFLEAQRDFARFQGDSESELLAWLRQILLHNLANFSRSYRATDKRQLDREVALEGDTASGGPARQLAASSPSPSQEAMEHEQAEALERALAQLPEEYRQVITLRHLEQRTFEEIGRLIGRSPSGARTLWLRAVERLNQELEAPP